ncbi:TPA: glycerol kinase [Citrobacter braakii]|uniref:ATP:glycerol 3-phosphotransferase n=1 Tax=Citrobacter braakii TaxID=57706 RepID=A0A1V8NZ68_CITBR|nr:MULTISPECIES: FGGY-family carbohydrate kinase [Citrobacter]MBM3060832.1 glycerol kinase [Citrobacter braakii]MBM3065586.1 glycerol kinase [Citrobacter braakii]MBS6001503.1 glycerol kinase [Citrobacter sp.]MDW2594023.1 FGGY-family carbohydrate kinase [Citrobacter braakii]MDW2657867.1 FGGY-family carbohydrate kinase [Citrobacter braakii]
MIEYEDVILAIDEGTSGTRAAVVARNSQVYCLEYQPLQVSSQRHGVVEQDADEILQATIAVCRTAIANAQRSKMRIVALAIATQRSTAVLWDVGTGKALVPAMVWQDARFTDELAQLAPEWDEKLLPLIGRPVGIRSPYLWASYHIANTPAVNKAYRAGTLVFGTVDSWLLWHLAQEKKCVTTPTNATSAGAYCLNEHQYHLPWLQTLNFPTSLLPELHDDADDFGTTREDILGISVPIRACAGDQFAGAIGLGCTERGQAFCMHGTGSFVDLMMGPTVPTLKKSCESTLTMTARRQKGRSHFSVETFVPTTGSALNWVCEKLRWFDSPEQISELAAQATDSGGVSFIPALTGLRVPHLQPQARASLNGISISTTRPQVAYAILEGIAHSVAACIRANEAATGIPTQELMVGGGLSNSDTLLQIQADISGIPVRRMTETARASLRGAAFLAGADGLLWNSLPEACATLKTARLFEPKINHVLREQKINRWEMRIALEMDTASSLTSANQEHTHS